MDRHGSAFRRRSIPRHSAPHRYFPPSGRQELVIIKPRRTISFNSFRVRAHPVSCDLPDLGVSVVLGKDIRLGSAIGCPTRRPRSRGGVCRGRVPTSRCCGAGPGADFGDGWRRRCGRPVAAEAVRATDSVPRSVHIGATITNATAAQDGALSRLTSFGIAMHMGNQFGVLTRISATLACLGVLTSVLTGFLMWWKRRPAGGTGLPVPPTRPPAPPRPRRQ